MRRNTKGENTTGKENNGNGPSRRRVLRATSAATVGVAGLTAVGGSASAGELKDCTNWPDTPREYPTVDLTRERPDFGDVDESELCLFVHGWNGREGRDSQAYALDRALREAGYDERVIVASWASDTLNFWGAEDDADDAGVRLARWLRDTFRGNGHTTIRVIAHSLGARVILGALAELDDDVVLDTVSLVGAAVEDDSVRDSGRYSDGIRNSAHEVYSYHSTEDSTICTLYDLSSFEDGLGCDGADCGNWWFGGSTPDNYHDIDVTGAVPGHCKYFQPGRPAGCTDRLVDDFA